MNPAADPVSSRDRLAYLRELRARLDPSGDPDDAMAERHVEAPGSVRDQAPGAPEAGVQLHDGTDG